MAMDNSQFWKDYKDINNMLKQAFIQMPGGQQNKQAQDPGAGGMPPPGMDPSAMGGMPPPGMDPSMMGGMPPPGMDPSMMGGMPPPGMDPMAMGMMAPPPSGSADPTAAPNAAPGSPMITISLDQLFEIIQKVLGLAKKVGANGQGIQQPAAAAPASQESQGITPDQLKATIYEALGGMAG